MSIQQGQRKRAAQLEGAIQQGCERKAETKKLMPCQCRLGGTPSAGDVSSVKCCLLVRESQVVWGARSWRVHGHVCGARVSRFAVYALYRVLYRDSVRAHVHVCICV